MSVAVDTRTFPRASTRLIRELSSLAPGDPAPAPGLVAAGFAGCAPKRGPGGLWLVLGRMSCQHVGPDTFHVLFYRDRIAAGDRQLLLIIPFEAVARGHHIGCRGELHRLAGDDAHLLIDIPDGLVADDGLRLTLDRDVAIRVEAVDLGVASGPLLGR